MSYPPPPPPVGGDGGYGAPPVPPGPPGPPAPPGMQQQQPITLEEPQVGRVNPRYAKNGGGTRTFVTQEIEKISSDGSSKLFRMMVINTHFAMQLTMDSAKPVVKRLLPLTDIAKINVQDRKIHFQTDGEKGLRDWLFYMGSNGSHSDVGEILTAIDKLRMLLLDTPRSLFPLGRSIRDSDVRHKKGPHSMEPKQLVAAYSQKKFQIPRRKHRPGDRWPPVQQQPPPQQPQQQQRTQEQIMEDRVFRPLDGDPQLFTVELEYPGEDGRFVYTHRDPQEGIRIIEIHPNGPYHRAGVPCGLLTRVEGRVVNTEAEIMDEMQRLQREGRTRYTVEMIADPDIAPLPPYKPPMRDAPMDRFSAKDIESIEDGSQQDPEEFLAEKLHEVATMRRKGALPDNEYQEIRTKIMGLLNRGRSAASAQSDTAPSPSPSPVAASPERGAPVTRAAPFPWGELTGDRYIYLRERPERGCPWVENGAAHGLVQCVHVVDPDWAYIRLDSGEAGYVRERYITYLPAGPASSTKKRSRATDSIFGTHLAELLRDPGVASQLPVSGAGGAHAAHSPLSRLSARPEASVASRSSWGNPIQAQSHWYDPDSPDPLAEDLRTDELAWLTL